MEQLAWILWIVLGIILIVAETFTLGFVCFGSYRAFAAALSVFRDSVFDSIHRFSPCFVALT
jgi:membrane protein implicated in regulation of membrane protease activity